MCHRVDENIYAYRIGFWLAKSFEIPRILTFAFPAIAVGGVVAADHAHAAFIIVEGAIMRFARVLTFPGDAAVAKTPRPMDAGQLRFFFEIENHVENRMAQIQFLGLAI